MGRSNGSPARRGHHSRRWSRTDLLDSGAERRTTRGGGREGRGKRSRRDREGNRPRVSPCIILASFERKQRPPRGALPFCCFAYAGRLKTPTEILLFSRVETAVKPNSNLYIRIRSSRIQSFEFYSTYPTFGLVWKKHCNIAKNICSPCNAY